MWIDERYMMSVIKNLMLSCSSLMDELGGRKVADWGLVNNSLVDGELLYNKLHSDLEVKEG